ncbi:MAG: hypothetical protein EBS05_15075 [Proteobacteria bacterium]|nr:hypothetical protein [Pseudomonadota bacterium]
MSELFQIKRIDMDVQGLPKKLGALQSQRDCVLQPRVARHELPWVAVRQILNPNGVVPRFIRATTPLGLSCGGAVSQGSSCLATLGFGSESRWNSVPAFSIGIRRSCIAFILLLASMLAAYAAPAPPKVTPKAAPFAPVVELPPSAWVPGYRVRFPLRLIGDFTNEKALTQTVIARLPAAGWLRPDGADICVQSQDGRVLPVAILSHHPQGETLIQFKRNGNDPMYWAYAGNPKLPHPNVAPLPEGVTVEFRNWKGTSLASWADVVAGLKLSPEVIANGFVDNVVQNVNPGRPDSPRNFAASYRGYLRIPEDGLYKFFVGAENAAFFFIHTNRIVEQTGQRRFANRINASEWREVELTAGVPGPRAAQVGLWRRHARHRAIARARVFQERRISRDVAGAGRTAGHAARLRLDRPLPYQPLLARKGRRGTVRQRLERVGRAAYQHSLRFSARLRTDQPLAAG